MEKNDYEQLYYDALHEIKALKKKIEGLEADLELVNKKDKRNIDIKNEILKEFYLYKNKKEKRGN